MSKSFAPMLASPADLASLRYPVLGSPKLDGIRAICMDNALLSRKLLPIPNRFVQALLSHTSLHGLDGELILGNPTDEDVYRRTNSAVMSHDGEPAVTFYVFDYHARPSLRYQDRMRDALYVIESLPARVKASIDVRWHVQIMLHEREELDAFEEHCILQGYEGIITRDPDAVYKFGRSTTREQIMLKVKRFEDSEAEVLRIEEEMFNGNVAGTDNLGRTKRSKAKDGLVGKGTMGALVVRDLKTGVEFNIGSGFTAEDRQAQWKPGEIVKYKFFPVGVKDKPRHPVFIGRRSKIDL